MWSLELSEQFVPECGESALDEAETDEGRMERGIQLLDNITGPLV